MIEPFPHRLPVWAVLEGAWKAGEVLRYSTFLPGKVLLVFNLRGKACTLWCRFSEVRTDEQQAAATLLV